MKLDARAVWFPNKVISKWPATILAIRRTAKVRGRIMFLIVSIITIKGIRAEGVLCGTKWANIYLVWLIQPKSIKANHRGRLRVKVRAMWLDAVKI